jgi:hypothetical protein
MKEYQRNMKVVKNNEIYDSSEDELEVLRKFVSHNKYPDYETMCNKLEKHVALWSEYGHHNHEWCKAIYENITNKDIIREKGELINKLGGFTAMQNNYYTLILFTPFANANNNVIRALPKMLISSAWHNVGQWKH